MVNDEILNYKEKPKFGKIEILLICCIVFQLIICLMSVHYGDGYFRDELYQIALSNHLGWGYVDVPPLAPFLLRIVRSIFGTSLFSLHLLPAIVCAVVIFLTYRMVKIFGGGFFAGVFALIPITLYSCAYGSLYLYDTFNYFFWSLMIYCLIKLFLTQNKKYWIYIGIIGGLGLMTKWTILFLGFGIVSALIITTDNKHAIYQKHLYYIQLWIGGLIAVLIFLPYIIWNFIHGFPTLDFLSIYAAHKLIPMSALYYIKAAILGTLPFFPIWFLGLYYFLFNSKGKKYRVLGIAFIVIFLLTVFLHTRTGVINAFYPVLFAGGAVVLEALLKSKKLIPIKIIYILFLICFGLYVLPTIRPVLTLKTFIKYYGNSGVNVEGHKKGVLPQGYADRFGWKELTQKVAKVYNSLPPKQKAETAIYTMDYGEAGAIALFGKKYGLPNPISGHNQYYIWGSENYTGKSVIMITLRSKTDLLKYFKSVKLMGRTNNKYCMPYENHLPIWLCTEPKFKSFKEVWQDFKNYS